MAVPLIAFVMFGGFFLVMYPRLLISDVNLEVSFFSRLGGSVTVMISGYGVFTVQSVTASLDGAPLTASNYYLRGTYVLPHELFISVGGPSSVAFGSTLTVAIDGLWEPVGPLTFPVHITAKELIQWTYAG